MKLKNSHMYDNVKKNLFLYLNLFIHFNAKVILWACEHDLKKYRELFFQQIDRFKTKFLVKMGDFSFLKFVFFYNA